MDQDKFIFILKCIGVLLIVIFFFTIILPKYKQMDDFITKKTQEFLNLIFQVTESVEKKSNNYSKSYSEVELDSKVKSLAIRCMTFSSDAELKKLIKASASIQQIMPLNLNIRQKSGYLLYMNKEFEKAMGNYEFILENVPKRKQTYRKLYNNSDYKIIKRALLELAAMHYDRKAKEKMMNYYKQFLRVAYPDEIYRQLISDGLTEKNVRFGIFSNFGGAGFFSYIKANEEMEKYLIVYPDDKKAIIVLAKNNFEIVNLFFDDAPENYLEYVDKAEKYLKLELVAATDYRKTAIDSDLIQLQKLRDEYLERMQAADKLETQ